ncbi:MAG: UvrB/UvrC motif-containing protein [Candidatus Peribacteria bacterium]|jgi:excinuclease ABC subunit B|nr:UvrB/UvrC motif-containing protein [Candidatus Peribacteria bacterium]
MPNYQKKLSQYLQLDQSSLDCFARNDGKSQDAFLPHLLKKFDEHIAKNGKILLITLTKKSSEEVTNFLVSKGYKAFYLHSEVATMDRWEIIKKLKAGVIDIIVGVNLLREGIDLPEVTLIAVLDADKEGFLRSTTSLIQIIGRAARNPASEVILYADNFTESMLKALWETYRRRSIQEKHNTKHGIIPTAATSNVKDLEIVKTDEDLTQQFSSLTRGKVKRLKRMTKAEKALIAKDLKSQLDLAIKERRFEDAAVVRDQLKELEGD